MLILRRTYPLIDSAVVLTLSKICLRSGSCLFCFVSWWVIFFSLSGSLYTFSTQQHFPSTYDCQEHEVFFLQVSFNSWSESPRVFCYLSMAGSLKINSHNCDCQSATRTRCLSQGLSRSFYLELAFCPQQGHDLNSLAWLSSTLPTTSMAIWSC